MTLLACSGTNNEAVNSSSKESNNTSINTLSKTELSRHDVEQKNKQDKKLPDTTVSGSGDRKLITIQAADDAGIINSTGNVEADNRDQSQLAVVNSIPQEQEQILTLATSTETIEPTSKHRTVKSKIVGRAINQMPQAIMQYSGNKTNLNDIRIAREDLNRENYAHLDQNAIKRVTEHPVSTFSIDVDTGAYSNMRRFLNSGKLPNKDAVRIEELVNYFNYQYPQPDNNDTFSVTTEIAATPWNKDSYLLHIGVKGLDISAQQLPASNLVFLVDVSGSMRSANKLELLKTSLKLLSKQLRAQDKISIVVYAGASGVVLTPTDGNKTATISAALDNLYAGGSTNGAAGIKLAYSIAQQSFIKGGINRIILATDGDFNVGTVNFQALIELVEQKRKTGISLTTLGFGSGNYNDHLMEQLANKGNGNYHYIDTLNEAQKVLVDEMSSTLQTIAKDVKIQIEFNKSRVAEYRLIGYENRMLKREDFNNDKVDAGEIGAGHTVTALYEITLVGAKSQSVDALRYSANEPENNLTQYRPGNKTNKLSELAFLKIRYKAPDQESSQLLSWPLNLETIIKNKNNTSDRFRFAAAVAAFGQKLKGGIYTRTFSYNDILTLARESRGSDNFGYRGEFIKLVNLAKSLS